MAEAHTNAELDDIVMRIDEIEEARPPAFTDEALALHFAEARAEDLRYVAAWSKWLMWDGQRWKFDDTLHAFDLARRICREAAIECNTKAAKMIASARTVAAVERLAKADRRLAASVEQWDTDPWQLNTPAGIVDLRSGRRRPHDPIAYATKITAAAAEGECPTWLAFLHRVTDGDHELVAFLQRVAGYALTGFTSAHALFFLYGTGANGSHHSLGENQERRVGGMPHHARADDPVGKPPSDRGETSLRLFKSLRDHATHEGGL